jgi:hypothetical protein
MRRNAWLLGVALAAGLSAGCVERRFVVTSDPPGALVLRNHEPIGAAPADDHFVYYGRYHFTLIKDGYETLQVDQVVASPWYEYFPLDFISENLVPFQIEDVRRFHYTLTPLQGVRTDELLNRGQMLRNQGLAISPPPPPAGPPAPLVPPVTSEP